MAEIMERQKLEHFRKVLETRRLKLRESVARTEEDGRAAQVTDSAQDIADRAASSYQKEFLFARSNNDRQFLQMVEHALSNIPKASTANANSAATRSTSVAWKRFPGRVIASPARRSWSEENWSNRFRIGRPDSGHADVLRRLSQSCRLCGGILTGAAAVYLRRRFPRTCGASIDPPKAPAHPGKATRTEPAMPARVNARWE